MRKTIPQIWRGFSFGAKLIAACLIAIVADVAIILSTPSSRPSAPTPMPAAPSASAPGPSPEELAAKQKDEMAFQFAVAGAKQLRESMRNPDSFRLNQTLTRWMTERFAMAIALRTDLAG